MLKMRLMLHNQRRTVLLRQPAMLSSLLTVLNLPQIVRKQQRLMLKMQLMRFKQTLTNLRLTYPILMLQKLVLKPLLKVLLLRLNRYPLLLIQLLQRHLKRSKLPTLLMSILLRIIRLKKMQTILMQRKHHCPQLLKV